MPFTTSFVKMNKHALLCLFTASTISISFCSTAHASGISLSWGQYEQNPVIGENTIALTPTGYGISGYTELTEDMSVFASYGRYSDDSTFRTIANVNFEKTSWDIGASYYLDNWSFSARYGQVDEHIDIVASRARQSVNLYQENYQSPSYSLSSAYSFDSTVADTTWYFNIALGIQYSDWELDLERIQPPFQDPRINTGVDEGNNTFADLSLSSSRYIDINENNALYVGGTLTWNHLLSGESSIVSRNGISTRQLVNARASSRSPLNSSSFTQSAQGEEYGIVSFFVSYDVNAAFSIDIDYSTSFSADENGDSLYTSLHYQF